MKNTDRSFDIPRPEHPEPQWERSNWVNLNGEWQFEIDNAISGYERGLHTAKTLKDHITVPFCPESSLSGIKNTDFMLQVWYKKSVCFDTAELCGKRVVLHFGAADYKTTVYINGVQAGDAHVGGQTPFSYDITKLICDGENIITVCCYDNTRGEQPIGKQSPHYESIICRYTRTTGIWQTVWYEIIPERHIVYARFDCDVESGSLFIDAELCGSGELEARVFYEGKEVGRGFRPNANIRGLMEIKLSETHLWEIGAGRLYDVVLRFGEDEVRSYFGMRTVELRDGKFYLNGKCVFQRLVLDQGFYSDGIWTAPTEDALRRDIELGIEAGFNGARLHQKVFEPRSLYWADKLGYIVWRETATGGIDYSSLSCLPEFLSSWLDSVKRDYNHPSVVVWCPLNETWDNGELKKRADPRLARLVYEETKRYDPYRPCVDTSGLYHVKTDIFDVHDYDQNFDIFKARYDKVESEGILEDKHSNRQKWNGEPFMVSEFGGIGYRMENNGYATGRKTPWCHRNVFSPEEFYEAYRRFVDVMLDNTRILGYCYTQLTDVEQEQNGFYTYAERRPKVDIAPLAEINRRKAAIEE